MWESCKQYLQNQNHLIPRVMCLFVKSIARNQDLSSKNPKSKKSHYIYRERDRPAVGSRFGKSDFFFYNFYINYKFINVALSCYNYYFAIF